MLFVCWERLDFYNLDVLFFLYIFDIYQVFNLLLVATLKYN